ACAGSAGGMAPKAAVVDADRDRGYALVGPQGVSHRPDGPALWSLRPESRRGRPGRTPRDDVAFLLAVIDDAVARFGLDRERGLAAGFSLGGSMVWDLACVAPDAAAAYAPVAGGFWEPLPESCAGPVRLLHAHGFADTVVPLEGRPIGEGADPLHQGDVFAGLAIWRETLGCAPNPDTHELGERFWRKSWTGCAAGTLDLVLFPGGHRVPEGWTDLALDWFEADENP
ncbi:MAG: hypothetical protein ACFE0R_19210, partial [Salinarimonas sp.]